MKPRFKLCTRCGQLKDAGAFHKSLRSLSGLHSQCAACCSERYQARAGKRTSVSELEGVMRKWVNA